MQHMWISKSALRRALVSMSLAAVAAFIVPVATAAPASAAGSAGLTIANFAFSPGSLTITAGTEVNVTNQDSTEHTWSSDPGDAKQWDSGPLEPGQSFSVTLTTPGTYGYHCNIHTSMTGTITVVAAPATTVAPTPTTPNSSPQATPQTTGTVAQPATATAVDPTTLPRTGASGAGTLVGVAVTLALVGGSFVVGARTRRRNSRS